MGELTDIQVDALREMGNIGAGNAATALSQLISEAVDLSIPAVTMIPLEKVSYALGGPEKLAYVVYLEVQRQMKGTMLTVYSPESALFLVKKLLGDQCVDMETELSCSALKELGSILCGSYLSALAQVINLNAVAGVPALAYDMLGAMMDFILAEIGQVADEVFFIDSELFVQETKVECSQLFIPNPEALEQILSGLGM
ncbi:MAG: chemotaxis protein CheC [Candidatus Omnitrophica bacterium]|nr:chemotaxis protein CheC [Candidatus Omnitrophota bacterium]MBU4479502.1 chemotaxis protein CheC [Candidatus Omnitrophota bacterium]MCG2702989.1 chemotaxis protein CheC [Candidatus Omnitrophota bacterium]